jgi:hypothetical protein
MDSIKVPTHLLFILNQLFEIENKLKNVKEPNSIQRNIDRMKDYFETGALMEGQGLMYHNPLGESYNETRADCEASISGNSHENLEIIEVVKPIIYFKYGDMKTIIQKAIVIVQSKNLN